MIRWRFVLTRLFVLVAILMLLRWGLGPVAKLLTIHGIQQVTGAKVEIAEAHIGLFPPRVQYAGLQIADPRGGKELRDMIRAEKIELLIDGEAMLQRRWIARDGRITGLRIGARRDATGHFEQVEQPEQAPEEEGPSLLSTLVGMGSANLKAQTEAAVADLETVRRSKEIRARWEAEYDHLVSRAKSLEKQIRDIRDQTSGMDNPLRDWPKLEQTLAKANEARSELVSVREALNTLPQRMQADLAQLDEARRIDLAKVEKFVPANLSEGGELGNDIMSSVIQDQIQRVRGYLDGGRTLANYTIVAPESSRHRGVDHNFVRTARPDVMVRRCEIAGVMRADGDSYTLTGILENLTPSPQLLAEPTRARLRLEGNETIRVEYVRDRRQQRDIDLVTVHWPSMDAQPVRLGNQNDAGIVINGGQRELWTQIRVEGDQIEGRLVSKQTGVRMDLSVDDDYADAVAVASLRESLASVDRIEVDASFEGTWRDIDLNLQTNLGKILRHAAQDAIDGQVRDAKLQLSNRIDQTHREQTQQLQSWLSTRQQEARELLAGADKTVEEMGQKVLSEVGDADAYLGRLRGAIRGLK